MDKGNKNFYYKEKHHNHEIELSELNRFIDEQVKCPLCRGNLDIHIEMIPSTYSLKEEARCVECFALSRVQNHNMH